MREYIDLLSRELDALRGTSKPTERYREEVPPPGAVGARSAGGPMRAKWLAPFIALLSAISASAYLWLTLQKNSRTIPLPYSNLSRR